MGGNAKRVFPGQETNVVIYQKVAREKKTWRLIFFNIKGKGMEKGGRGEGRPASGNRSGREGERGKEGETERQAEKMQGEIKKEMEGGRGPPVNRERGECTQKCS